MRKILLFDKNLNYYYSELAQKHGEIIENLGIAEDPFNPKYLRIELLGTGVIITNVIYPAWYNDNMYQIIMKKTKDFFS